MSDKVREDLKKAMCDTKPVFYMPNIDHQVRFISKNDLILAQILKNQLLIMHNYRKNCDIKSQNSFQEAINSTQKLLNGEMK